MTQILPLGRSWIPTDGVPGSGMVGHFFLSRVEHIYMAGIFLCGVEELDRQSANHSLRFTGTAPVIGSDQGSNRFQAIGDLEAEYWREREIYLNDLEYDSDAWDRYERDHDRSMSQLRSQLFDNVSQK